MPDDRGRVDGPFPGVYGDFAICREMKTLSDHYRRMGAEVLSATSPRKGRIYNERSRLTWWRSRNIT